MDYLPLMLRLLAGRVLKREHQVLLAELAFLRAENAYYRQQMPTTRFAFTVAWRRRFAETGAALGWARLKQVCTVAAVGTIQRWNAMLRKGTLSVKVAARGRPRTPVATEQLVLRMSKENPSWGALRIVGELKKVGITICVRTISAIWKRHGVEPPDPQRRMHDSIWKPFLADHADEIVATDFFTADVWGWLGKKTVYVLFYIHLATRRVHLVGLTEHPDEAYMQQIGRNETMQDVGWLKQVGAKYMIHDRDTKYCASWKQILKQGGVETLAIPANSPNLNAYAERWVRSIKNECIRRLTFLGLGGLRRGLTEYLAFYNDNRPHQTLDNCVLPGLPPMQKREQEALSGRIRCQERCGGVLKHYYLDAA